ncbi:MAG: right-handed parallel beta-helix repeat-containing protein [Candidatus Cloacimonadota bacterium]
MKHIAAVLFVTFFLTSALATVWHVNNDPTFPADFTQLSTAVSSAEVADGDTIYLYGSVNTYSSVTVTKALTIIGPGYFLGNNPGLQHKTLSVNFSDLTLYTPNTVLAGVFIQSGFTVTGSNISVIGCRTGWNVGVSNNSNVVFQGCYFGEKSGYNSTTVGLNNSQNIIFSNCYFGGNNGFNTIHVPINSSATILNCVISGTMNLRNTEFYNNIVYKVPNYDIGWNVSATVYNNVFTSISGFDWSTVVDPATNHVNYSGPLFVDSTSPDGKYVLVDDPANLALTGGFGGTECGIFGGSSPYKLSGMPSIPSIYMLNVPASGSSLPITVKARVND